MSIYRKHRMLVEDLAKPGRDIVNSLTANPEEGATKAHLLHMAVGVAGEAGELLDAIKKHVIYDKALDLDNVIEELGDIEFYMQGLRAELGLHQEDILEENVTKLRARYAEGSYSNEAAQTRRDKA